MKNFLARLIVLAGPVRKALGSVLGGATGVGVDAVLNAVGFHITTSFAGVIALVLAGVGTYLAPANAVKAVALAAPVSAPAPEVKNG